MDRVQEVRNFPPMVMGWIGAEDDLSDFDGPLVEEGMESKEDFLGSKSCVGCEVGDFEDVVATGGEGTEDFLKCEGDVTHGGVNKRQGQGTGQALYSPRSLRRFWRS